MREKGSDGAQAPRRMPLADWARNAVRIMQAAVNEEMLRKARLGFRAVIADRDGRPRILSARRLVAMMRRRGLFRHERD